MHTPEYGFSQPSPNLIVSTSGHTIEILGRAGLRVGLGDTTVDIDSEMLNPPMSLVIYTGSVPASTPVPPHELMREVVSALEWAGFTVDQIP